MKKMQSGLIVVLLLMLALAAGCGNKNEQADNAAPSAGANAEASVGADSAQSEQPAIDAEAFAPQDWPAADLPDGFPVFSGGTLLGADAGGNEVVIYFSNPDKAAIAAYQTALEQAGYVVNPAYDEDGVLLEKDNVSVFLENIDEGEGFAIAVETNA